MRNQVFKPTAVTTPAALLREEGKGYGLDYWFQGSIHNPKMASFYKVSSTE
jgi:hypothetical protein